MVIKTLDGVTKSWVGVLDVKSGSLVFFGFFPEISGDLYLSCKVWFTGIFLPEISGNLLLNCDNCALSLAISWYFAALSREI